MLGRNPLLIALAWLCLLAPHSGRASESDPWTYAYIPLDDSASKISRQLGRAIRNVVDEVNSELAVRNPAIGDTDVEFAFFARFRERYIRDIAWGMFEWCIGTNDCDGWPAFERIQMYPQESVFRAAHWRYIPARFHLASIIEACGVRMGADKLSHFFDDAFHYYNALRSKSKNLDPEDIRRLSMAYEESYMGTRITGIVSRADVEANLAGVEFYGDIFGGENPLVGRAPDGLLVMLRQPDFCAYATRQFDERVLPDEYTYGLLDTARARVRAQNLQRIIAARSRHALTLARELDPAEIEAQTETLLARRIPMTRWQRDYPKPRMLGIAAGAAAQYVFDRDFRQASRLFVFNPLDPDDLVDRKPVDIAPAPGRVSERSR